MMRATKRVWLFAWLLVAAALGGYAGAAIAHGYPDKPIHIVVPSPPGGPLDTMARMVGSQISDMLHQPVIVENRRGANGDIAASFVARSKPDGYTMLITTDALVVSRELYRKLPFDPKTDFTAVTQLIASPQVLVVNPKVPVKSMKELIALAKAKPGKLTFGDSGLGKASNLMMQQLKHLAGIDILGIPYRGSAQIRIALLNNQINLYMAPLSSVLRYIKIGRLRALAVTSAKRSAELPNVPTVTEEGLEPLQYNEWHGLFMPAKTPRAIVDLIQKTAAAALETPTIRKHVLNLGLSIVASTPQAFEAKYQSLFPRFAKIVKEAHIPVQD